MTIRHNFKVGTAEDSSAEFPTRSRARRVEPTRHISWGSDTGENSRVNAAKSETIPGESKAEYVADTILSKCAEKRPTHQYPDSACEQGPSAPERAPSPERASASKWPPLLERITMKATASEQAPAPERSRPERGRRAPASEPKSEPALASPALGRGRK